MAIFSTRQADSTHNGLKENHGITITFSEKLDPVAVETSCDRSAFSKAVFIIFNCG
jgi:hypothetical protein